MGFRIIFFRSIISSPCLLDQKFRSNPKKGGPFTWAILCLRDRYTSFHCGSHGPGRYK